MDHVSDVDDKFSISEWRGRLVSIGNLLMVNAPTASGSAIGLGNALTSPLVLSAFK